MPDHPSSPSVYAALLPHAPVLIPAVAQRRLPEVADTVRAMHDVAERIVLFRPTLLILISPHSPHFEGAFALWDAPRMSGTLAPFGHAQEGIVLPVAQAFVRRLITATTTRDLLAHRLGTMPLDHGAVVPLWFLVSAGWNGPTVVLGLPDTPRQLAALGEALRQAIAAEGARTALIASGDMSHRLNRHAPCGYHPDGERFDRTFLDLLRSGDSAGLSHLDEKLCDAAAEDASASTLVALSALGFDTSGHDVLSYQGPFGVGYGVAILHAPPPGATAPAPDQGAPSSARAAPATANATAAATAGAAENVPVSPSLPLLARLAVATHLGVAPHPDWSAYTQGILAERGPVFVTLHTVDGALRGCIGSLSPQKENLLEEIRYFAVTAACRDHRFAPVRAEELDQIRFSVTRIEPLEPVASPAALDPQVFGVAVQTTDGRRAVLLPAIEGIDTVEAQLRIVRRKGGIAPDEPVQIQRFRATCWEEGSPPPV